MPTATSTATITETQPVLRLRLNGTDCTYGDFRDDLARDGYAVVKGAVSGENAAKYVEQMHGWLEGL